MSDSQSGLRVLHVIPSVSPRRGGPSKAIIEMVAALRKSGLNAEIATTNDDIENLLDVSLGQVIEHQGVPVRFFHRLSPPLTALREFTYSPTFTRWLKRNIKQYDVVHVHALFSYCSTRTMQIARQHGIPYAVRPIGQLEQWSLAQSKSRKNYYLKWFERKNLKQASCVQFTAEAEKQQAIELLPQLNSEVIPLGLDIPMRIRQAKMKMEKRWNLMRDVPTLLFLSRLHKKKGLELLLPALARLSNQEFQLIIAGDGDEQYTQTLKELVLRLGLQDHCHFIGFVTGTEKNLLLQGADLYTLTSHSENFGIAVLEAMASGTCVLVSEQVALSKQIAKANLGFVTPLEIGAIEQQLENALQDIEQTQELGRLSRTYVKQHFQWSQIAKRLHKLYQKIAA